MSIQEAKLKDIADAIREKDGTTAPIPAVDFPDRIRALPSGGLPEGVYTITVEPSTSESGSVSGGGVASEGMTLTVEAKLSNGYKFVGWQENGQIVSTKEAYTFIISGNRALVAVFAVAPRLPEGYMEVQYIEIDSKTGIDSGFVPNLQTTKFVVDISDLSWDYSSSSVGNYIFNTKGVYSGGHNNFLLRIQSNQIKYGIETKFSNFTSPANITDRLEISVDCPASLFSFGSEKISFTSKNLDLGGTLYIGNKDMDQYNASAKFKIYSARIYNGLILVRDYVPCVSQDGSVGLYDLVESKFYGNSFTGVLTPGPAI